MSQTINVDMTPNSFQPSLYYSQGDIGREFKIKIVSQSGDTIPAGATVTIQATKPSGFGFSVAADSVTDGVATFTTTAEMTDEFGRFPAELKVVSGSVTIFSANFQMVGERNTHPEGTIDGQQGTIIPELTVLVERVEAAASSVLDMTVNATTLAAGSQATYSYDEDTNTATFGIPQGEAGAGAVGVTASAYSSSKTYAVGDYVIHNSNLYRCTTAITTAEAFTAAHWTQVVLGDDVSDLKSAIDDIDDALKTPDSPEYVSVNFTTNSGFLNAYGDVATDANSVYTKIPVKAGEKYYVSCGLAGNRSICFYNGTTLLSHETATSLGDDVLEHKEFTMPANCTTFGVTSYLPDSNPLLIYHYADVLTSVADIYHDIDQISSVHESTNLLDESAVDDEYYYNLSGTRAYNASMAATPLIPVEEGKIVVLGNDDGLGQARYVTAYNSSREAVAASGAEYVTYGYTVPSGIAYIRMSATQRATLLTKHPRINMIDSGYELLPYEPYGTIYEPLDHQAFLSLEDKCNTVVSENVLNPNTLELGKFINTSGTMGSDASYAVTDFIEVSPNAVVSGYRGSRELAFRFITAYDSQKKAIASAGAQNVETYTVPSGVKYIRATGYVRSDNSGINASDARMFLTITDLGYQEYKETSIFNFAKENYTAIQKMALYPLTTLPPYFLKALAYKPLGALSKGYICLVSDDGGAGVVTYTIPMVISKEVPCTFAVMKASECWDGGTNQATVIDAVENHGCEIAQHGGSSWLNYDEYTLNLFFDEEKAYWDSLGLTPYGAVCPTHAINDVIRVVAGGRFGCVRTGYENGIYYGYYCNGGRSNLFGLSSQSSLDGTLDGQKSILDDCKENHWLRMIHWHEAEMDASDKAQLEGIIDYAKSIGLTFITMKDIPTIV